ncbi:hypothetical protein ACFO3O_12915 [Dokdonia ponticola]|uniref:Uncharacterized protein n=1 Tax=Dokdonia ponticola TaxID=2041041 RepID=A0ABV9HZN7_9FLAO
MKSTFFKPLTTLFILILTIGCSVENEEIIEQTTFEQVEQRASNPISQQTLTPIQVTYVPNLTHAEVNAIRATYTNDGFINLSSFEYCPNTNHEVEIWYASIQPCNTCGGPRDPKGHLESNSGVSKVHINVDHCNPVP